MHSSLSRAFSTIGALGLLALMFAAGRLAAAEPAMMKAARIEKGAAQIVTLPVPVPGPEEVLVQIRAAAVNPVDYKYLDRPGPGPSGEGSVPGFDAAGVIVAIGAQVRDRRVGDEVIAFSDRRGAYAEYVAVPVSAVTPKPAALSFEQAAGIPTVAYAAWATLVDIADVKAGQRVLVHGAAGGTGSAAVQIAKARGAYVIGTASQRNHEYLKSIGADEVIDYRTEKFEDRVKDVDVVFNNVDAETATRSIAVTKRGGIVVSISGAPDETKAAAAGVRVSMRQRGGTPIGEVLRQIADLAAAGKYDVNVDRTFALTEVNEAWAFGREGRTRGKIVIKLP